MPHNINTIQKQKCNICNKNNIYYFCTKSNYAREQQRKGNTQSTESQRLTTSVRKNKRRKERFEIANLH